MATKIRRAAANADDPDAEPTKTEMQSSAVGNVTEPMEMVIPETNRYRAPARAVGHGMVRFLLRYQHSRWLDGQKKVFEPGWHTIAFGIAEDLRAADSRKWSEDQKLFGRKQGDSYEVNLGEIRGDVA